MEHFSDRQERDSSSSTHTKEAPMQNPPIHITESGIQFVKAADVIRSKDGWAEIQRLKQANLVRRPASGGEDNSSSQSNDSK